MALVAIFSAAICVAMLALGLGLLIPISGLFAGLADLAGIASAMVFIASLDGG